MNAFYLALTGFFLFSCTAIFGQEKTVHSVYFDFDKDRVRLTELPNLVEFLQDIDTTRIETIEIFGYCDDRGKDQYNMLYLKDVQKQFETRSSNKALKTKSLLQ